MNVKILIPLVCLTALTLVACGGAQTTKPVEDKSVGAGAEPSGAVAQPGAEATPLDTTRGKADLLGKRRVYFAFDSSAVDDENRAIVEAHAAYLASNKSIKMVLEGHADERGTREYNLALGERRAMAVARMFKLLGVSDDRIKTVSFGEEKPVALDHTEAAWTLNRRVEIVY